MTEGSACPTSPQSMQAGSRPASATSSPIPHFFGASNIDRSQSTVSLTHHASPLMPTRSNSQGTLASSPYKVRVSYGSENYPVSRSASRPASTYSYDSTVLSNVPDQIHSFSSHALPHDEYYDNISDSRRDESDYNTYIGDDADRLAEQLEKLRTASRQQTPEYEYDKYSEHGHDNIVSRARSPRHHPSGARRPLPMPPG